MHEDLKCEICNEENETQKHILECKILNKNEKQILKYEKIENGNIFEMVQIVKKFKENLVKRDKTWSNDSQENVTFYGAKWQD